MDLNKIYKQGLIFVLSKKYRNKFNLGDVDQFSISNSSINSVCKYLENVLDTKKPNKKHIIDLLNIYFSTTRQLRAFLVNFQNRKNRGK